MRIQFYLLNRTYIAEDVTTGLVTYGSNQDEARGRLEVLVSRYWEEKRVVVPIVKIESDAPRPETQSAPKRQS